ncbi:MAG: hypothetical protein GX814_08965 [Microbacteriaceae bacterium]|nr:hypothetical protein [Microbacteriaceae bacterium]
MHTPARAIAWLWVNAGAGAAFALPAAVAAMANPALGFALAVGVLPPAAIG